MANFMKRMSIGSAPDSGRDPEVTGIFVTLDADNDGFISFSEMRQYLATQV